MASAQRNQAGKTYICCARGQEENQPFCDDTDRQWVKLVGQFAEGVLADSCNSEDPALSKLRVVRRRRAVHGRPFIPHRGVAATRL